MDLYTCSTIITTREHQFKLFKECSKLYKSNSFINRITNDWNSLPNCAVNSSSIHTFKLLLDSYLLDSRFSCIRLHWLGIQAVPLPVPDHNHNILETPAPPEPLETLDIPDTLQIQCKRHQRHHHFPPEALETPEILKTLAIETLCTAETSTTAIGI